MKETYSEKEKIKAFIFTVDEYKRFSNIFDTGNKHSLLDAYTEEEYIKTQTKLMILRKYSYKPENVYIPTIVEAANKTFADIKLELDTIKKKYDEIEKNQLQSVFADGKRLSLFEMQECVVYGLYLHADKAKILNLLDMNESLYFVMARKFVEEIENVLFELYDLLSLKMDEKYERKQQEKAHVVFSGAVESSKQEITGSQFWTNLYGKDATYEDLLKTLVENTNEDTEILFKCMSFLNEAAKDDYSIKVLEEFVFPPTRDQWGDFSLLNAACKKDFPNLGFSSKVRYNDQHDMAYVHLFPKVDEPFLINEPHVIGDLFVITLVNENNRYGWRIFAIGGKIEKYKETISVLEWLRRVFRRKNLF